MPIFDRTGSFVSFVVQAPVWIKIGLFFLAWVSLWIPFAVPLAILLKWQPFKPLEVRQKLPLLASLYLLAPLILWGFARFQGIPFSTYGLSWNLSTLRAVSWGIGIGSIGVIILFGIQTLFGWVRWKSENLPKLGRAFLPIFLIGWLISAIEELVFRGFLLGQLLLQFDFWTAAIVSSGIFAVLHLIWEGKDNVPQLPGLALMGVVLCLAVAANFGSIGLAWGLHTGWIWVMGSIDSAELMDYQAKAPELMTGLDRKPLAGLLGSLFLLATAGVLLAIKFV